MVQRETSDVKTLKDSENLLYAYHDELKVVMFLGSIGGRLPMQVAMVRRDSVKQNKWDSLQTSLEESENVKLNYHFVWQITNEVNA